MASPPHPVVRAQHHHLTCFKQATQCATHDPLPTLTVAIRFLRSHVNETQYYAPYTHALLSKHIWPSRFNGLKPLGYLSTYTCVRLRRGRQQ